MIRALIALLLGRVPGRRAEDATRDDLINLAAQMRQAAEDAEAALAAAGDWSPLQAARVVSAAGACRNVGDTFASAARVVADGRAAMDRQLAQIQALPTTEDPR